MSLANLAAELSKTLAVIQPGLTANVNGDVLEIAGEFRLSDSDGVYDRFQIKLKVFEGYPTTEPKLYETGGRIPYGQKHHINPDGSCCFGVWEKWYLANSDRSVEALLRGPIKSYFVSQVVFELKDEWPFGEHAHGGAGLVEAGAELFRCHAKPDIVVRMIDAIISGQFALKDSCPCSSGKAFEDCHAAMVSEQHKNFSHDVLKSLRDRIESQGALTGATELFDAIRAATKEIKDRMASK